MFEDIKKEDEKVVAGNPAVVEDMFDPVDPAAVTRSAVQGGKIQSVTSEGAMGTPESAPPKPGLRPKGAEVGPPNPLTRLSQAEEWSSRKSGKGLRIVLIVVILITVTAVAAYFFFNFIADQEAPDSIDQPVNVNQPPVVENQNTNVPVADNTNTEPITIPTNALIDTDGDGLTDVEEQEFGTDPTSADTDGDGLSDKDELRVYKINPLVSDSDNDGLADRDEILVWLTDPRNEDTDGDGFLDGIEVSNGFNPNGPGRLAPTDL